MVYTAALQETNGAGFDGKTEGADRFEVVSRGVDVLGFGKGGELGIEVGRASEVG